MANIIEFKPKAQEIKFNTNQPNNADPIMLGFYMLEKVDSYSDHFWNNYQEITDLAQYIVDEFDAYMIELKSAIKMFIQKAENEILAGLLGYPSNTIELVEKLKLIQAKDFQHIENWFSQMQIPFNNKKVIQFKSIKSNIEKLRDF